MLRILAMASWPPRWSVKCGSAGAASLQDTECFGGLWANRTLFSGRADLRGLEVHGRTWLVGATVADDTTPAAASRLLGSIRSYGYRWV